MDQYINLLQFDCYDAEHHPNSYNRQGPFQLFFYKLHQHIAFNCSIGLLLTKNNYVFQLTYLQS